jgi:hypothetical protein
MTTPTLEERLTVVEEEIKRLKQERHRETTTKIPAWKKIVGAYRDDPEFDEAERLGREYRESLRPKEEEISSPRQE